MGSLDLCFEAVVQEEEDKDKEKEKGQEHE